MAPVRPQPIPQQHHLLAGAEASELFREHADQHLAGDRAPHWGPAHPVACLGAGCDTGWAGPSSGPSGAPPSVTRTPSTAGSRSAGRRSSKRPTGAELPGLLRRVRASLTPNVRRSWAPKGQAASWSPFTGRHALDGRGDPLKACAAAAPSSPSTSPPATTTPTPFRKVLRRVAEVPRRREGDPAVGRAAGPSQQGDAGLAGDPAVLAWSTASAPRTGAEPGRGPVVLPQGR